MKCNKESCFSHINSRFCLHPILCSLYDSKPDPSILLFTLICIYTMIVVTTSQVQLHISSPLSFTSTNALVFFVPMFLLTFHAAVRRVPTTVIHGFFLAIVTLKTKNKAKHINVPGPFVLLPVIMATRNNYLK